MQSVCVGKGGGKEEGEEENKDFVQGKIKFNFTFFAGKNFKIIFDCRFYENFSRNFI